MSELLGDNEPMMNKEHIDEGAVSFGEDLYRQEVYKMHSATDKALGEKLALTRAAEVAAEMTEEVSAGEEQSGGEEMEEEGATSNV